MQNSVAKHVIDAPLYLFSSGRNTLVPIFLGKLDCGGDGQTCKCISKKTTFKIYFISTGCLKACALLQQALHL